MGMISNCVLISFALPEVLDSPVGKIACSVLVALVGLGVLGKLWAWSRRRQRVEEPTPIIRLESRPELSVDFPLLVRNLPSHLAAVVVAPLSGSTEVPAVEDIPKLVDRFLPGLSQVIEEHRPIVKNWPRQYSATGFGHSLVRDVQIPDDQWRESRWCLVCGPGFLEEQRYVVGLVVEFKSPNNMDLVRVESDSEWTSVVHVDE